MPDLLLTKIGAIESQLEAATYLMLRSFRPEPIQTLIGAARGILYEMGKHQSNAILDLWDKSILNKVAPGGEKEWRDFRNRVSNFLKHAKTDPGESISDIDLNDRNEIDLQLCILAFTRIKRELSPRLNVGFCYLILLKGSILPIDLLSAKIGPPVEQLLKHMRDWERSDLRAASLDTFEKISQA